MGSGYGQAYGSVRREVFVSYHHRGDQTYYDEFSRAFHDTLKIITDNSLERQIDSLNQRLREAQDELTFFRKARGSRH